MSPSSQMTTNLVLTGFSSGIGYQTAKSLLASTQATYRIFGTSRDAQRGKDAADKLRQEVPQSRSVIEPLVLDLESDESIEGFRKEVEGKVDRLDVLVNNSGVQLDLLPAYSVRRAFLDTWSTNVAGPHILTTALVPLLLRSPTPRLLFLTSGTASLALTENPTFILNKVPPPGWPKPVQRELPAYKSSKMGLNMIMREWERVLRGDGVKVWAVNPGFVVTGLGAEPEVTKGMGAGDARSSGEHVRDVVEGGRDGDVGKIVNPLGGPMPPVMPW